MSHPEKGDVTVKTWRGHSSGGVPWKVMCGDVRAALDSLVADRFDCVVTSPPYYWQRDYGQDGQIGLEPTIAGYVCAIADSMEAVRRVLTNRGTVFLNIADTYYSAKGKPKGADKKNSARRFGLRAVDAPGLGVPRKTVIGIPWRVALAMIERGWVLRAPIIWRREAPMPEPTARDRPWRTYEMVFMFSKSPRYYFDRDRLKEEEDIWTISSRPRMNRTAHPATFPEELVERCLDVGCPLDGRVLDPFAGTGTTLVVAARSGRSATGVDIKQAFCEYMVTSLTEL